MNHHVHVQSKHVKILIFLSYLILIASNIYFFIKWRQARKHQQQIGTNREEKNKSSSGNQSMLSATLTARGPPLVNPQVSQKFQQQGRLGTYTRSQLPLNVIDALNKKPFQLVQFDQSIVIPSSYNTCKLDHDKTFGTVIIGSTCSSALDQQECGSCWAFSCAGTLTDRIRDVTSVDLQVHIHYKEDNKYRLLRDQLSPYFLAACDFCRLKETDIELANLLLTNKTCNEQCQGGILQYAYQYIHDNGIVSLACDESSLGAYYCHPTKNLNDIYPLGGSHPCHLYKFSEALQYNLYSNEELEKPENDRQRQTNMKNIQRALLKHGTVSCSIMVYPEFYEHFQKTPEQVFTTKSKPGTQAIGGHAVCIVGWDVDLKSGVPYWWCRNSWGTKWGIQGFFKYLRGANLNGIEADVWGSLPDLDWLQQVHKQYHLQDPKLDPLLTQINYNEF